MTYNTGNALGSTDVRDLLDNAHNFDDAVNDIVNDTWIDRFGVTRKTLKGYDFEFEADQAARAVEFNQFLENSGYETPVDYAPGISIARPTQIVRYLGELYRPKDSSLPFVTTTFDADATKWIANGDNSLRQDLAARGAELSGFIDNRSPAFLKTVSDIINMVPVSVLRLVPKGTETTKLHNGTSTFPLAGPINGLIQAMNSEGGGAIDLTHGVHRLENFLNFLSNVSLEGLGDASILRGMFASPINRMITSPAATLQRNIRMSRFKLDRSVANSQHGILTGGIDGLTIDGITVEGFGPGVTSGAIGISAFDDFAAVQSKNVAVKNTKIISPNNFGIAFGNVSGGSISKNLFENAYREAIGLECWGNTSAVEDIVVDGNLLRMNTQASNHVGGSIGPGILVGGAGQSYGGVTRRCILVGNIITIANPAGVLDFSGIAVVGGTSAPYAAEDISLLGNTISNAPANGISIGSLGSVQRRVISRGNNILNPNSSNNGYPAIYLRAGTDCVSEGDVIVGTQHSYAVYEDTGALRNTFLDVVPGTPVDGNFHRNSDTSRFSVAGADQATGGARFQEFVSLLAAGQTIALANRTNPNRGSYRIEFTTGAWAEIHVNGSAAPVIKSKSADVVVAATDTGTANAFTIFPVSASALGMTNRTTADVSVVIESLGAR